MMITNAQSARAHVASWANESPTRRVTMFTIAIEGQETARDISANNKWMDRMWGHVEAIGVLRVARMAAHEERAK